MGVLSAYRRVLGNRNLTRLLFGEFVSSIGDWLYMVAILVLIWEETQDALVLGLIGAIRIIPYIVLSVPAGIVADRFDRRMVLLVTDLARGAMMVLIAIAAFMGAPVLVIVALTILSTCFAAFFSPTIGAYLPSLARDESELGPANSAWSSLDNLAFFIGPAFAALLLNIAPLPVAFLLNALTFGVVALVLLGLPSRRAQEAQTPPEGTDRPPEAQPAGSTFRAHLRSVRRPLIGLAVLNVVCDFIFGGLGVITILLSVQVFQIDEAVGTGLLNSAIGVGGVVGALVAGALVLRRRLGPPLVLGGAIVAIGMIGLGLAPGDAFGLALVAMAVTSAGALLLEIVNTTLLQRVVPDAIRGRTLGIMETIAVAAYAAGSFAIPVLAADQPGQLLVVAAIAIAITAVVAVVLIGSYGGQQPARDDVRAILAEVPLFTGLSPARLETAIRRSTVRPMSPQMLIIRQGDEADNFYVIADGRVEVTQTDSTGRSNVLRQMGRGEFFGEIGLLSRVPRTATVTATTAGTLVSLDKEAFLELVESGPGLTHRLLSIHRGAVGGTDDAVLATQPVAH
jgi:MFS family permease